MSKDLTDFIEEVCGDSHLRVEDDLGDGFVRLRSSEAERRQARHDIRSSEDIVIELLRNARDADAQNIFLAVAREGDSRLITMIDDGLGIPASMQKQVFEPRVTSKLDSIHMDRWGIHGRGMALFSIRSNTECAQIVSSDKGLGTALMVRSNTKTLAEKTDQSSWPTLTFDTQGTLSVRGPRNINRCAAEFALEEQDMCTLYLGSPIEISATLYAYGLATTPKATRAFHLDSSKEPLVKRLCFAADPSDFVSIASTLGLSLSERSARRILDGDIAPLSPFIHLLDMQHDSPDPLPKRSEQSGRSRGKDRRGLKISSGDLEEFTAQVGSAYREIAQNYYLDPAVQPHITIRSDGITVHFPVRKLQ